ncbi:hypothetical protein FB451DRAFT_1365198 [Mycena latifolia]|nr:hypothetical protein FB451DRAFT_1365198 [Mycena latifolia]
MSLPTLSANIPQSTTPFALRLRRATMACSNCRRQKIKEEDYRSGVPATSSKSRRGHRAPSLPPLPYTGPPPFSQTPRYAGHPYPDLSLPSVQFAHPNFALPQSNQGPWDSRNSGSALSGWAGPIPAPSSVTHHYPSTGYPANPSFVPAPATNHAYILNRMSSAQSPATPRAAHHPDNYSAVHYFAPAPAPGSGSAWPHDPTFTQVIPINLLRLCL